MQHAPDAHHREFGDLFDVATPLWGKCEVATHTPENETWESFGTLKIQNRIAGVKTPCIEVLFILLERSWSVDV
jgi:hypothetical protein